MRASVAVVGVHGVKVAGSEEVLDVGCSVLW